MNDNITQQRLSMRLDRYLHDYAGKNVKKDSPCRDEWNAASQGADIARINNTLTPEMIDDVRIALNKL
jgi:hypothetical protein